MVYDSSTSKIFKSMLKNVVSVGGIKIIHWRGSYKEQYSTETSLLELQWHDGDVIQNDAR